MELSIFDAYYSALRTKGECQKTKRSILTTVRGVDTNQSVSGIAVTKNLSKLRLPDHVNRSGGEQPFDDQFKESPKTRPESSGQGNR